MYGWMDVFPTLCHYDTRGRGRAVLRHAPQAFVMTMIGFLLGEARVRYSADAIAFRFLCGKVDEADIHFYTRRGRIGRMQT